MLISDSKIEHDDNLSDVQLLAAVVLGDVVAFEKIVNRYKGRLYNFVFRFVGDQETAEDIVQETFLRAYRRRKEYRAIANFSTWLFTIAGNLAKSELRRRKRWRFLSLDWDDDAGNGMEIADESLRPDTMAESSMTDMRIQEAIDTLPANYRQVVILRDIEGLSYQEIAEIARCPVGTVKSRVNRGRLRLQQKLKVDGKDVGLEVK
jgi:RNA polymerase sigma-70 factor (ECF subfamily)